MTDSYLARRSAGGADHRSGLDLRVRQAWVMPNPDTPYDIWTRTNVGEVFPSVLTPLTWSVYLSIGEPLLEDAERYALLPPEFFRDGLPPLLFTAINGRLWFNAGLLQYTVTERFGLPSWFYSLSLGGPREGERLDLPSHGLRPLRLLKAAPSLLREQRRQQAVVKQFERDAAAMRAETDRLRGEDLSGLDAAALLARLDAVSRRASAPYEQVLDGTAAALNAYGTLAWLCERWLGDRTLANDLVTGLTTLLTAQASVALWQVAHLARDNAPARRIIERSPPAELNERLHADPTAAPVADALDRFFAAHGHRSADEFELAVPRWSEEPSFILSTLRTYLDASPDLDPTRHLARQHQRRRQTGRRAKRLLSRGVLDRLLPWRQLVFRTVLREARRLLPMRENPKHHFLLYAAELRRIALALGGVLHGAGVLAAPDDVFFTTRADLEGAVHGEVADLRPLVDAHRRMHARFLAWNPPEVIHGGEREALEEALFAGDPPSLPQAPPRLSTGGAEGRLTGIAASAGTVTAPARVALTPEEGAEIEPGEVLIAPFTDPGWTPLFTVAGAIVMDLGGLLSHGAIVAREYGIPAVVNTRTATRTLRTGQMVTVNGSSGEVTWDGKGASDGH